jgi:acetyl/propionyl-CoA carboxylase alpha subunit
MKRVLVANRGEIACRVIAALREAEIASVAVHSDVDREAMHVRAADEAVEIGPAAAAESYLAIEKILEAAAATSADTVHPGYGFLAENARFAEAVEAAGLTFLGPRPETIALLGDKREARAVAAKTKVPVVPGWEGDAADRSGAAAAAQKMGWPVLVKAALGGGGKGMTRVDGPGELSAALDTAARVAASAFGDASIYLEKLIVRPRHVEVQILGDGEGNVVHLFERECSLQRRHQKVFEESPAPSISEKTRRALTKAAVAIGKHVKYRSAGTCEFLVDADESFWFLEVNARIQVEHPVTELVTGRDLVRAQLEIARDGRLPFAQADVSAAGCAVEARLYAEDPDAGFLPQSGDLLRVELPSGPWIRVDCGVATGDTVSPHYDPMLAKIVAFGSDRETAWRRLTRALGQTVVHGPVTNLDFLREVSSRPEVIAGDFHTQSIEDEWMPERERRLAGGTEDLLAVAAALADRFGLTGEGASTPLRSDGREPVSDPFSTLAGWRQRGLSEDVS